MEGMENEMEARTEYSLTVYDPPIRPGEREEPVLSSGAVVRLLERIVARITRLGY